MALRFRKFPSVDDLSLLLRGHILGGVDILRSPGALYLHGKTLIFTTPSATVTFAASPASAQVPLTVAQVIAQVEAQATGVSVNINRGAIELYMTTPGAIALNSTGTANGQLGFDSATPTTGAPFNAPGGSAPALVQIVTDGGSNAYMVVTDE